MKRLLISSLFSFICLGSYLLADEEEYASFIVNNSGIDSCAIGLPVITSAEQSVTQSIQQQWTMLPGEQCTKLTYYGYNPGKAITRHFEVWMGRINDFAFFVQNLFVPKEKLQKVFDGECTIAQGGSKEEPIALLEIPFDVPFIANNYTYTCIQILSSGEATNDVFFQVCNSGKGLYTIGSSGEQQTVNDVAIDYTIKSKVNHYLGNVKNQESRPIAEAKIIMKSNYAQYETATDEAGNFDISITRDCKYDCLVMASGHTFFYESHAQFLPNLPIQYELFDKFSYKAGKRYTIMLPYEPNAEVGKYFRFDRVEGSMFIFEREFAPQANCPYVFVPSKDMQLDVNGLELSLEPICIEIDKVRFIGAYGQSFMVVSTNNASWHGENPVHDGQEMSGTYLPLQGVLYWDSMQYPGAELVFNDPTPTYRPFIEEGKRWTYVRTPDHPAYSPYFYEYYLEGDTVIGGQKCLKLFSENEYNDNKVIYKGSLYEEDKKVYAFLPEQGTADLLYDFGCEVDDEICVSEGRMLVTDIIQREYDGMTLRFYNLLWLSDDGMHNVDGCVWVEGIGGLIDFFQTVPTIGSSKWLYRCEVNGEALYRYEYVQPKYTEEDYHEMAIEGKTWNYIHHYIDEKGTHVEEPYSYVVRGDTIIEQKICKKLYYQDSKTERFVCALWETGRDLMKCPSGSESWQRTYQFGRTDIGRVFDWDSKQGTGRVFWMLHDRDTITVNGMDYYRLTFYSKTIDGGTTGMLTTIEDGPDVWHEIWVEGVGSELNGIEDPVHEKPLNNEDYTRFVSCYEDGVCIFTANDFRMEKPDPATTYRPFIEEGKVWKVGSPDLLGEIYCLDTYYFEGDTIVGNKTCKKMMCHTEWKESYGHEPWTGYVGALYEESKRTYIAHPGSQQFVLLYDFAAPVGTTIDFYDGYEQMPSSCLISKKYMSTDSIFHGMVTEIKMYDPDLQLMTSTTYSEWREGVGYNCIQNVYNLNKNTDKETLKSCTVGDEVLYYNPKPIDTITPVGGEVKKQWLDFTHTTKPRPKAPMRSSHSATEEESLTGEYSAKELFVSLQSLSGVYTIRLTDAAGNEVYCKEVQTSNVVALNTDLTQYAEGTYTLTVENAAELYTATLSLPLVDDAVRDLPSSLLSQPSSLPTWTDLSGRRLTTPPTQKGVYIRNSRKVLIK